MRRLLLLIAAFTAVAAVAAVSASAAKFNPSLTLTATPGTAVVLATGEETADVGITGTFHDSTALGNRWTHTVTVTLYDGAGCTGDVLDSAVVSVQKSTGVFPYGDAALSYPLEEGVYSFKVEHVADQFVAGKTACLDVTVSATPVAPTYTPGLITDSYLCWNRDMVNPVAYPDNVADTMWATGNYFEPQAILGNVVDGTNIGAYHLVCNAPSTMTETDQAIGGSGEVYDAAAVAAYHHDHPVNGNDLNIYHIWK